MQTRGAALMKLADAAGPLYRSLDDAQKHRFIVLARMLRPHGGRAGFEHAEGRRGAGGWHRGGFGPGRGPGAGPMGPMGPQDGPPPPQRP